MGPLTFKAQIINWLSSTRAELAAIEYALLTVPYDSTVTIYTDSQVAIDGIQNYNKATIRRKIHLQNWIGITKIAAFRKEKHLTLNLVKIKGHNSIMENDIVDELAK